MGIALVPREVRALAEQLNAYFRVLKGVDADSVLLRLNPGGRFEVRHSGTAAPVFTVTDDGAAVTIGVEDIQDGAITTDKIADGTILDQDISPSAGIQTSKLAHLGAHNVFKSDGTANIGGKVIDANVDPAAAIAVSKLAGGGTAQRVVATADGTAVAMQQVNGSMIAEGTLGNIHYSASDKMGLDKIGPGPAGLLKSNGTVISAGSLVTSGDITDGAIMNVDINAAAAIALTKLAPGASGVLKSNGTVISAGNTITSADITDGTITNVDINATANIDGAKLLDNSVPASKLSGAAVPPGSIDSSHLADNSIMNVDVNAAAGILVSKLGAGGSANRVVQTPDGTTAAWGQITAAMLAPGAAYTLIATAGPIGAPVVSFDFASIPSGYRALMLIVVGRGTAAATNTPLQVRFNNDTAANYDTQAFYGQAGAAASFEMLAQTSIQAGSVAAATAPGGVASHIVIDLPLYAGTTFQKTLDANGALKTGTGTSDLTSRKSSGFWRATAAINRVTLTPGAGDFDIGSFAALYGLPS